MYYNEKKEDVVHSLESSERGLSDKEASLRLQKHGQNIIERKHKINILFLFLRQFFDPLVLILIIVTLVSLYLGEYLDSVVIVAIIIIDAVIGFFNEYRAEKSIELLQKLSALQSKVLRNGTEKIISSLELVPGDIIILETGDKIGADARLLEETNIGLDESILTGESTPVNKQLEAIGHHDEKIPVAEQNNIIFSGTSVVSGRGKAIVIATGMNTEMGKIAGLVQGITTIQTPLQKKLKKFSEKLTIATVIISIIVFIVGLFRGIATLEIFKTAIALAVAVVPEGLPAVVTITLALGVRKMLKRNALIRKLRAVETLGSTRIICSDKTGTLTKNEMTVKKIYVHDKIIEVTGEGYSIEGSFLSNKKKISLKLLNNTLNICAGCNNAVLPNIGDPTELALLILAKKANINRIEKRIREVPFDSKQKYMSTTHKINNQEITFIKGAPETVLDFCKYMEKGNKMLTLSNKQKKKILEMNHKMTLQALRVLGTAYTKQGKTIFSALVGMIDPPRKEVKHAIKTAHKAGIRVIMITGDHKNTAQAIANDIGIKGEIAEGKDLTKESIKKLIHKTNIFARVNPEHKVLILEALQKQGEVVAMTGDGVNDAPALKKADIGIAMGVKGTDIARDASDMVLIDDNFASIVKAVKEGRIIYDNIKKFVQFLLSANVGEIGIIIFTLLLGLPLPLLPLQLLWLNLATDGLPALALGVDNPDKHIMKRKPRSKNETILTGLYSFIAYAGIISTVTSLGLFYFYLHKGIDEARTVVLTSLVLFELFLTFSCRSKESVFKLETNKWLWISVILSTILHVIILYTPLNIAFKLVPLSFVQWLIIIAVSSSGLLFFEVKKVLWRS